MSNSDPDPVIPRSAMSTCHPLLPLHPSSGPVVCIIDTGINLGHPDLVANIHPTKGFSAFTMMEGDAVNDDNSHGTHCAGGLWAMG